MAPYKYTPLNTYGTEIRLLCLNPGKLNAEIACNLVAANLTNPPVYEALSYTWGNLTDKHTILLDDQQYQVTSNLYQALRRLRDVDRELSGNARLLWVDAICINQEDVSERNHEVRRMRQIYSSARQVIIWLGEGTAMSGLAMDFLQGKGAPKLFELAPNDALAIETENTDFWLAFGQDIMRRPYWSRVWIIQEIVFALEATVICGSKSVPWENVERAVAIALKNQLDIVSISLPKRRLSRADVPISIEALRMTIRSGKPMPPLWWVLSVFNGCEATQPADMVYALLGLADDPASQALIVDYAKPVTEIYKEVSAAIITCTGVLDFLCTIPTEKSCENLPSWTPNLNGNDRKCERSLALASPLAGLLYKSAGDTSARAVFYGDNDILGVLGLCEDEVRKVGLLMDSDDNYKTVLRQWQELYRVDTVGHHFYPRGGNKLTAFWRTMNADIQNRISEKTRKEPGGSMPIGSDPPEGYWPGIPKELRWARFQEDLAASHCIAINYRRLIITEKDYVGLAPAETREGDKICVLLGCSVPVVLRKERDGYIFIGQWYRPLAIP
jgi:hypothetical protein